MTFIGAFVLGVVLSTIAFGKGLQVGLHAAIAITVVLFPIIWYWTQSLQATAGFGFAIALFLF